MRITKYNTILNADRLPVLVKEFSKNYLDEQQLNSPMKIVKMMNFVYNTENLTEEFLWALCFDTKYHLKGIFEISHGLMDASLASPREVFQKLCLLGAHSFVLVHNHPSGDTTPSKEDKKITERFKECGELMNITLLDHIIIGEDYYSFLNNNKL